MPPDYDLLCRSLWASEHLTTEQYLEGSWPEHLFIFEPRRLSNESGAISWLSSRVDDIERELLPSREYHKQQALRLFQAGKTLFFSDVAKQLEIGLREAVEICKELIAEKKIYVQKSTAR